MTLYDRIRTRREQLNMSQEELAKRLGYKSRSTIAKIESGENDITQSKIVAFAKALGVKPGYLMGWEDVPEPSSSLSLTPQEETHIKKYRQLDADGREDVDDYVDMKLAKLQRKAEEDVESLG